MSHFRVNLPNMNNKLVGFGLTNVDTFIICVGFGMTNIDTIRILTRQNTTHQHELSPLSETKAWFPLNDSLRK